MNEIRLEIFVVVKFSIKWDVWIGKGLDTIIWVYFETASHINGQKLLRIYSMFIVTEIVNVLKELSPRNNFDNATYDIHRKA